MYWQFEDRKTVKRINNLLEDIKRNGAMQGIGKPEPLRQRPGYSRRIGEKNRLVYDIDELQNIKISGFFPVRHNHLSRPQYRQRF